MSKSSTAVKEADVATGNSDNEMRVTFEQAEQFLASKNHPRYEAQKASGILNPIVLAECLGVRPQMIYNYISKGRIKTVEGDSAIAANNTQKKTIEFNTAVRFAQQYLSRKQVKQDKIEAELRGEG